MQYVGLSVAIAVGMLAADMGSMWIRTWRANRLFQRLNERLGQDLLEAPKSNPFGYFDEEGATKH